MDFPHLDHGRKTFYDGKYLIMPKITPIHWRTLEKVFLAARALLKRSDLPAKRVVTAPTSKRAFSDLW